MCISASFYNDEFRVGVDQFCDIVPFVSTCSNLIVLFQKFISCLSDIGFDEFVNEEWRTLYWKYIDKKDCLRCILLSIPFFNIPVAIYYYYFHPITIPPNTVKPERLQDISSSEDSLDSTEETEIPQLMPGESPISIINAVLPIVISYIPPNKFKNILKVCHLWRSSVEFLVKNALSGEAFKNSHWRQFGGRKFVENEDLEEEKISLSSFIDNMIQENICKAIYMMRFGRIVRMSKDLNYGNIEACVRTIFPNPIKIPNHKGFKVRYEHAGDSYWFWVRKKPIKQKGFYSDQCQLLNQYGYQAAHLREMAAFFFAEYALTQKTFHKIWARCLDKSNLYANGNQPETQSIVTLNETNLHLNLSNSAYADYVVFPILRWQPTQIKS